MTFITNAWYVAAWTDEVTDKPLARRILNEPVVLFRDPQRRAAALADMCCHRGAPLSCGQVVASGIECGYHGMVYDGSGACVHIPGQVHIPAKARVRSYPVVEKDTCVWIWMGDPAAADPATIVDYPYLNDGERWPHMHAMYPIGGSAYLMVDNLMDLTHLGYVHGSTIGGNPQVHVDAIMDTQPTETGLKFTRWLLNSPPPPTYKKAVPALADRIDRWQEFEFVAPAVVLQWVGAVDANTGAYDQGKRDGGFSMRIFHTLTPETETSCHYFWSALNGFRPNDPQATRVMFDEVASAFKEDQWIVQAQQTRLSEFGEDRLINIVADGARVHMRRVLERMLAEKASDCVTDGDHGAIRDLIERWVVYRDAGDWERFRTLWHDDGRMAATWTQSPVDEFIESSRRAQASGMSVVHFLGGQAIDVAGDRAISQTKMTISVRGSLEGVVCDIVCIGRFFDFLERRKNRWGLVFRQPIYEKDRADPVDTSQHLILDPALLARFPEGYRHLAYFQSKLGFTVKTDMPGVRGEALEQLTAQGDAWLAGSEVFTHA